MNFVTSEKEEEEDDDDDDVAGSWLGQRCGW